MSGSESFLEFSLGMVRHLMEEEETRAEHQVSDLHLLTMKLTFEMSTTV